MNRDALAAPPEDEKNFTRSQLKPQRSPVERPRSRPETGRCYSAERAGGSSRVTGSRAGGLIRSLRAVRCIVVTRLSEFSENQDKLSHLKYPRNSRNRENILSLKPLVSLPHQEEVWTRR
ncbi:hypothetical protein Q7C36_011233 [Tachysurus vachellii]|uniref:Uncharacterized protein n=1 Tax=Tachysurus vachellii TaxID=175792 RepID=A0AA88SRU1_TACVA|nr:hypothetical protein Q7C36_011233 [Tachysurus vachellii]